MTRSEILAMINGLKSDLKTAEAFLALYDRNHPSPSETLPDKFPVIESFEKENPATSNEVEAPKAYGALAELVRTAIDVISETQETFGLPEVMLYINQQGPIYGRDAISQVLSRLARGGEELSVVQAGKGRRPARYMRALKKLPKTISFKGTQLSHDPIIL